MGTKVWVATLDSSDNGYCPVGVYTTLERAQAACVEYSVKTDGVGDAEWVLAEAWAIPCYVWEPDNELRGDQWQFFVHEEEIDVGPFGIEEPA